MLAPYAHLGLPIIILAPSNTALANWAERHELHSHLSQINDKELLKLIRQITNREIWTKMAEQSRNVFINEFNPELIQTQFKSEIATNIFYN